MKLTWSTANVRVHYGRHSFPIIESWPKSSLKVTTRTNLSAPGHGRANKEGGGEGGREGGREGERERERERERGGKVCVSVDRYLQWRKIVQYSRVLLLAWGMWVCRYIVCCTCYCMRIMNCEISIASIKWILRKKEWSDQYMEKLTMICSTV